MWNWKNACLGLAGLTCIAAVVACDEPDDPSWPGVVDDRDAGTVDSSHENESGPTQVEADCDPGLSYCDDQCVGLSTNPLHCGSCSNVCDVGQLCVEGSCVLQEGECPSTPCSGFTYCDEISGICRPGCERDAQCAGGQVCDSMTRTCTCPSEFHLCGGRCASDGDVATCGDRCLPCPSSPNGSAVCVEGTCQLACDPGFRYCTDSCAACPSDAVDTLCEGNQCVANACGPGKRLCNGQCASCPSQNVIETECAGSQCVASQCYSGYGACGGACVPCPPNTTVYHCTQAGQCEPTECGWGYHVCNQACVDSTSLDHCGGSCAPCPTSPNGAAVCESTGCKLLCNADSRPCSTGCCPWKLETVDNQSGSGALPSVALDSNGRPWIAHLDTVNARLRVSQWTGTNWSTTSIADASYGQYTYDGPHIAIHSSNEVAVAVVQRPSNQLRVFRTVAGSWTDVLIDTVGAAGRPNVAYRSSGSLAVFYHRVKSGKNEIVYAYETPNSWVQEVVAVVGSLGGRTSLVMGPGDQPLVAFFDSNSSSLRFATRSASGNWSIETPGYGGYSTAIAMDKNGEPAIAYTTISPLTLNYAHRSGGFWGTSVIDPTAGSGAALAFDTAGHAHTATYSGTSNRVRYGRRDASSWVLQTVEAAGFVDASIGFAVTKAGDALIAFQQDDRLKMVR